MTENNLNWITSYIWGIADDVLRDLYVRGKYRDVILPMTVLRRLDVVPPNPPHRPPGVTPGRGPGFLQHLQVHDA